MTGKQITGVILLLVGLVIVVINGVQVLDLMNFMNTPFAKFGMQAMGMSSDELFLKYGGLTLLGVVLTVVGIIFAKKAVPAVEHN